MLGQEWPSVVADRAEDTKAGEVAPRCQNFLGQGSGFREHPMSSEMG